MGKNLMLYLAVRNGILIIVGIGYLYKIVKKEKLLPKIDDPPVEMGLRIITGVALLAILIFYTIPCGLDIPNMIHEKYSYVEGVSTANSPEDSRNSRAIEIETKDGEKVLIEIIGYCSDVTYGDKVTLKYLPHSKVGFVVKHEAVE